jgi:phospholipase/lecithinase/hemolysin
MKALLQPVMAFLLFGLAVLPANAAFKSLYVFGDSLSATADPKAPGGQYFYGQRWSNGRVWVEVLAQRQGLTYNAANNNSYWDHNSAISVTDIKKFVAPLDVANDLFIVWVCNADTFDAALASDNSSQWLAAINQSQTNHLQIITNLYAKGVRSLILPNAVDLSEIPACNTGSMGTTLHAECVAYNVAFSNTIKQAKTLCPGLKIYSLDFYTLLNKVLANTASYGLTNALSVQGLSIDAYSDPAITTLTLTNAGTNYIFWGKHDPTAMFHEIIADIVQQSISPVQIGDVVAFNGSNRLDVVNVPVGLNGFVDGCTNLAAANWMSLTNITSATTALSVFVPTPPTLTNTAVAPAYSQTGGKPSADQTGLPEPGGAVVVTALEFYRLHFPYAWNWP